MARATSSITISRPIEDVFGFLADGERCVQWRSGVLDIRLVSGDGVGARYAQGVKGPMGRRVAADYDIVVFEAPTRLDFQTVAGPVRPHGRFDLEPVEGGTRVTFSLDAELPGLRRLLMGAMVQRSMDAEVAALGVLKRVMEEGAS